MEKKSSTTTRGQNPVPDHLLGPLRSLYKWRRPILLASVAALILSAVVSLLLPVYFTAETSFIALSPDQSSPEVLFGGASKPQTYGNADDIDRLLTLAESNELIDYMVQNFGLYEHYDIDPSKQKAPVMVRREFLSLYGVTKTPRDAIEISIQDTDPQLSADMANSARDKIGEMSRSLQRSSQGVTLASLQAEIADKNERLGRLDDSLAIIREQSGIYNHVSQSEALSSILSTQEQSIASAQAQIASYEAVGTRAARDSVIRLEASLAGMLVSQVVLDSQLTKLNSAISSIENMNYERTDLNSTLNRDRDRMKQYQRAYQSEQKALAVIQHADVPVIKSWPRRSIIVVGMGMLTFLLMCLVAIAIDNSKNYRWRELLTDDD